MGKHGDEFQRTGSKQSVGPNLIIDGPPAPGSYPWSPDRSLVRTSDPRITDQTIPARTYPGKGSASGAAKLNACEEGTGKF